MEGHFHTGVMLGMIELLSHWGCYVNFEDWVLGSGQLGFFSFVVLRFRVLASGSGERIWRTCVCTFVVTTVTLGMGEQSFARVVAMEEIFALFVVSLQRFFSWMEVVEVVKCLCLLITTRYAFFPFFCYMLWGGFFLVHEKRVMHVFIWFVSCLLLG